MACRAWVDSEGYRRWLADEKTRSGNSQGKKATPNGGKEYQPGPHFPRCATGIFLAISARFPVGVKRP